MEPHSLTRLPASYEVAAVKLAEMSDESVDEAEVILQEPWLNEYLLNGFASLGITGESELAMTIYLVGTSRLLKRPLAAIVQGPSSSGKSYTIERVAELFPEEAVYDAGQLTPNALVYEQQSLRHRFVVAGERSHKGGADGADATRMLREMLSAGRVTKRATVSGPDGSRVTEEFCCEGPIAYVESTTLSEIFDEDANRCLLLHTNETKEQTRDILCAMAKVYERPPEANEHERLISVHHAIQRLVRPHPVSIPFAGQLAATLPNERMEIRRLGSSMFRMIETVTLLNQYQRETAAGKLISTAADYELARRLMEGPASRFIGNRLSPAAGRLLSRLEQQFGHNQFSTRDCKQVEDFSPRAVQGWLTELHDTGRIRLVEASRGRMPAVWELIPTAAVEARTLPTYAEFMADQSEQAA